MKELIEKKTLGSDEVAIRIYFKSVDKKWPSQFMIQLSVLLEQRKYQKNGKELI